MSQNPQINAAAKMLPAAQNLYMTVDRRLWYPKPGSQIG
jgi:hypothetical protein